MMRYQRETVKTIAMLIFFLALISPVIADNDPGHDSLYVLLTGDSAVRGSINISDDVNVSDLRFARILYGAQMDIRANGSIYTPSSRPALQADSSDIYLDANGNLYINTLAGSTGIVQVGPRTGSGITLNVSGDIYSKDVLVCLSNGTNCVSGTNSGNVTSIIEGNGISVDQATGDVTVSINANTCGANQYSYWDGNSWECGTDDTGPASGWSVSAGIVYNNTADVKVGIGTNSPAEKFSVADGNISINSTYSMCFNDGCTSRIYFNGTSLVIEGT